MMSIRYFIYRSLKLMNLLISYFYFFKLNFLKILIIPKVRSAKDYDRLAFEYQLCKLATDKKKKVLYVGIHERSFVYQLVFPFTFCDIDTSFLIHTDMKRTEPCQNDQEIYDLGVLSGVFGYGTDSSGFKSIIDKNNFKSFLILDWIKNLDLHKGYVSKSLGIKKLKRSFYYFTDKKI